MTFYYVCLVIFFVVAYLIVTDESFAAAFYYVIRLAQNKIAVYWWWLLHNPSTPWARYIIWRRSLKLAKELMNEIEMERKSRESNDNSKTSE